MEIAQGKQVSTEARMELQRAKYKGALSSALAEKDKMLDRITAGVATNKTLSLKNAEMGLQLASATQQIEKHKEREVELKRAGTQQRDELRKLLEQEKKAKKWLISNSADAIEKRETAIKLAKKASADAAALLKQKEHAQTLLEDEKSRGADAAAVAEDRAHAASVATTELSNLRLQLTQERAHAQAVAEAAQQLKNALQQQNEASVESQLALCGKDAEIVRLRQALEQKSAPLLPIALNVTEGPESQAMILQESLGLFEFDTNVESGWHHYSYLDN